MSQIAKSDPVVRQALRQLALLLGIETDAIEVVRAKAVIWPDGSLGCPQPGMQYPQVLIRGSFIQLLAQGQLYNFHAGGRRPPFLCPAQDAALPADPSVDLLDDPAI